MARIKGWIGIDLDGTLARHDADWHIDQIGAPVPLMVDMVKDLLRRGTEVRIVTARVGCTGVYVEESQRHDDEAFASAQRAMIEEWCIKHIGQKLPVTCSKDFGMMALYDDRAIRVETNTGRVYAF